MFAIMVKFVLFLAAATIVAAAVLPNAGPNSSLVTTTLPKEGGGFVPHCCKFFSSISILFPLSDTKA